MAEMRASLRFLKTLTAALIAANIVASTPSCHDCTPLNANEADTCSDFDSVVCCDNTDSNPNQCSKEDTNNGYDPSKSDFCDLPNAEASSLAPHDGLQYKLFDYDDSGLNYGLYLQWPEPLNTTMLECYQLSVRFSNSGDVSKGCTGDNDARRTIDAGTREFVKEITYPFTTDQDQDVFIQVAAVPLFVWTLSIKVASQGPFRACLKGCPGCECNPPLAPTNLNWSQSEDEPSSVILSWEDQDHSSKSVYYLHMNSSVDGKLLYRVEGKTSVTMTDLIGEVTVWLESYGCGCSADTSEQITFTIDGPSTTMIPSQTPSVFTSMISLSSSIAASTTIIPSQTPSFFTSMISLSSSIAASSTTDVPPPVTTTTVTSFSEGTPTSSAKPTPIVAIIATVSVVGMALFVLVLVLVFVMVSYRLHRVKNNDFESKEESFVDFRAVKRQYTNGTGSIVFSSQVHPTRAEPYVLLIFSQKTPHNDQNIIRSYGSKLNKIVTVKMYDVADRSTRTAWLEQNYGQASAILCVCNEAFVMEWNNANSFAGGSIVSAVKMIVQGQIEHQTVPEKFAALFINEEDRKLTPPYLKNVRSFELCPENIESISRFALSVNEYEL